MLLVVDMQSIQTGSRYRGIGQYSVSLVRELLKQKGEHRVVLLINNYSKDSFDFIRSNFSDLIDDSDVKVFNALPNAVENSNDNLSHIKLSEKIRNLFIANLKPDAVLITSLFEGGHESFICSVEPDAPYLNAVIGYDLIPLISPDKYISDTLIKSWYMRKIQSLINCDLVLAISESAQNEFINLLKFNEDVVHTISTACSQQYYPLSKNDLNEDLVGYLPIDKYFILYSGAADERKNIHGLISAFSRLEETIKNSYQVVLVGKYSDFDRENLKSFAKKQGLSEKDIIFTGYVSNEVLNVLYNQCALFVFPSFHEGFGLPVLEAISSGAPTICSNTTSLPEVINFPEAMFDPGNVEDIARCMQRALTDSEFRRELVSHGLQQAKKFTWEKVAERTWLLLNKKVKKPSDSSYVLNKRIADIRSYIKEIGLDEKSTRLTAECLAANDLQISDSRKNNEQYSWRIEGPFDSSYSLALLNRETARGLSAIGQKVVLYSTEGPGDFAPDLAYLEKHADIKSMYENSLIESNIEIVSRNLYPPRTSDMYGETRIFHHYAWEESGFPKEWVASFNQSLDGLTCLSEHVRKTLIDNGVALPLLVTGCGVDHWDRIQPGSYTINAKSFKFLHVSSCFPRKGIDSLLAAYGMAFSSKDDVSLVIKTFDNPHNDVRKSLKLFKKNNPDYPDVNLVFGDLSESDLKSLYEQCDVLVAPSKAEGFGLPLAEAILSKIPIITTAWGGQLDFCNPDTAWLVDYSFSTANSHFNLPLSVWAEPNLGDLSQKMREVYNSDRLEIERRVSNSARLLRSRFKWTDVASRLVSNVTTIRNYVKQEKLRVGWVTTWNQRCGIATYSSHLIRENFKHEVFIFAPHVDSKAGQDSGNVIRCWHQNDRDNLDELFDSVCAYDLDAIDIQMNTYFYDYDSLFDFVKKVKSKNLIVTLTLHSTLSDEERKSLVNLRTCLDLVDRVFVHSVDDLNRLKSAGVVSNAMLFPHGIINDRPNFNQISKDKGRKRIASYGFALPHKGIEQLIDAYANISKRRDDVELVLLNAEHNDPSSSKFIEEMKIKIFELGIADQVEFINDFLPDQECLNILGGASVIALPYQKTGESSSGAVKVAIASQAPVIVSPLSIFDDVKNAVDYFEGTDVTSVECGIVHILDGKRSRTQADVEEWCEAHSYSVISNWKFNVIESLKINNFLT